MYILLLYFLIFQKRLFYFIKRITLLYYAGITFISECYMSFFESSFYRPCMSVVEKVLVELV